MHGEGFGVTLIPLSVFVSSGYHHSYHESRMVVCGVLFQNDLIVRCVRHVSGTGWISPKMTCSGIYQTPDGPKRWFPACARHCSWAHVCSFITAKSLKLNQSLM